MALERSNGGLELGGGLERGEQIPARFPRHKQQDLPMDCTCRVWKRDKSRLAFSAGAWATGWW